MVMFLALVLGALYMLNNIDDDGLSVELRKWLVRSFCAFLVFFLLVMWQLLTMDGFAVATDGVVSMELLLLQNNLWCES